MVSKWHHPIYKWQKRLGAEVTEIEWQVAEQPWDKENIEVGSGLSGTSTGTKASFRPTTVGYPPPGFETNKSNRYIPMNKGRMKQTGHSTVSAVSKGEWPNGIWVFCHNLPPYTTNQWLEKKAPMATDILSSVVCRAPNHRGKWFGFILLNNLKAANSCIRLMNGRVIDGFKLLVVRAWRNPLPDKQRYVNTWKKLQTFEERMAPLIAEETKKQRGSIVTKQLKELQNSYLVVLHNNLTVKEVLRQIALDGVYEVTLRSLGHRLAILYCSDPAFHKELEKDKGGWLKKWLTILHDKQQLCLKGGFYEWISIKGVPFQAWCEETFQASISNKGQIVFVHPETNSALQWEEALVLIHNTQPFQNQQINNIILASQTYTVLIKILEDAAVPDIESFETQETHSPTDSDSDSSDDESTPMINTTEQDSDGDQDIGIAEQDYSDRQENVLETGQGSAGGLVNVLGISITNCNLLHSQPPNSINGEGKVQGHLCFQHCNSAFFLHSETLFRGLSSSYSNHGRGNYK